MRRGRSARRHALLSMLLGALMACAGPAHADDAAAGPVTPLAAEFQRVVTPCLQPPADVVADYVVRMRQSLEAAGVHIGQAQFVALVDRSPQVQALLLLWGSETTPWQLVGAAPVSTGRPGRFEHFATPLGVYEHSMINPDFRAEGTKNEFGIRGYGRKGSRIYDFGWVSAPKGWGDAAVSVMRLQMHATDPELLERKLGTAQSKGCIRIPASLNDFMDRFGVLDKDYEEELGAGRSLWVLRADRVPTPWPGRYLVVIDSLAAQRPAWAPGAVGRQ